jgi:hypothetical protein
MVQMAGWLRAAAAPEQPLGQNFDRDRPAQQEVFGAVHHAHSAGPRRRQAAIA